MINTLRAVMGKIDNMQEYVGDLRRDENFNKKESNVSGICIKDT